MKKEKKSKVTQETSTTKKKKAFLKTFKDCLGIVTDACYKSNISRRTYYNWRNNDEEFAKAVDDIQEDQIDYVESKLFQLINELNPTAVIFYLKTKGKNRGYSERLEVTGKDGKDIVSELSDEELEKKIKVIERKIKV